MMKLVSDIMINKFITVNGFDGIQKIRDQFLNEGLDCFPVMLNNKLVGILTCRDLLQAHPNRIALDAMSSSLVTVPGNTPVWRAGEIIETTNADVLVVYSGEKLSGIVTKVLLYSELGKHIDPLTGLHKTEYIYYNGVKLIENGSEISVIFIDINNFGFVDKEYGHTKGDIVLKEIGHLLNDNVPADSFSCRFGGDEFMILTPYTVDECINLAKQLLKSISSRTFCGEISVTAAAGIAGGRRMVTRTNQALSVVTDLINLASLASTKAKKEKCQIVVSDGLNAHEIA